METSSVEEKNPLFLTDEKELKAFAQKVDDWKAKKLALTEVISEFSTSTVLQALSIPANKVSIDQLVLKKINALETEKVGNSYGHDIDIGTIKQIPNFLADPIMVYKSASRNDSYTVLTEAVDKNNESILIALQINKFEDGIYVNNITSAYGKDENEWFIEQVKLGNLVYQDKKRSLEWTNPRRLSLPNQMTTQDSLNIIQKEDSVNKMNISLYKQNDNIYGFAHNRKNYLNPEIMNSEVAVHEYTHLWDNYIQRVNPELWYKGLDIFKNTKFWNEVKADPNYADIAHDDNLLLSEVHAKICGKMAESILEKIIERDAELTKDTVIDWDKECWDYLGSELGFMGFPVTQNINSDITHDTIRDFLSTPMKFLMNGVNINLEQQADKIFSKVMENQSEAHKIFYNSYEKGKSDYLDGKITDLSFAEIQKDYIKSVQVPEVNEMLEENPMEIQRNEKKRD